MFSHYMYTILKLISEIDIYNAGDKIENHNSKNSFLLLFCLLISFKTVFHLN